MKEQRYFQKIEHIAEGFDRISLADMDSVKLMNRVDSKYLIPLHLIPEILEKMRTDYRMLVVNEQRLCSYRTLYYDTDSLTLYRSHLTGRLNRFKIRFRNYADSDISFLEVKLKNNKGRTVKTRIPQENQPQYLLTADKAAFVESHTPFLSTTLKGQLWVNYQRITLVSKTHAERLTLDISLTFEKGKQRKAFPQLVIAEVKQTSSGFSAAINVFKKYGLRPCSLSKYCLGVISLVDDIRHNRFKINLLHLKKTIDNYDFFTDITTT